jgi:hypothetical protein
VLDAEPEEDDWAACRGTHENRRLRRAENDVLVPESVSERPTGRAGMASELGFDQTARRFEQNLAKVRVAGSSPVVRSRETPGSARGFLLSTTAVAPSPRASWRCPPSIPGRSVPSDDARYRPFRARFCAACPAVASSADSSCGCEPGSATVRAASPGAAATLVGTQQHRGIPPGDAGPRTAGTTPAWNAGDVMRCLA